MARLSLTPLVTLAALSSSVSSAISAADLATNTDLNAVISDVSTLAAARVIPRLLPLCGYATTTGPLTAVALVTFDPALYAIAGKTTVITIETTGSVSAGGLTGTVTLQNLTDATSAATLAVTATTPTTQTASVTLPAAATVFELRLSLSGIGYVALGALLRITWI